VDTSIGEKVFRRKPAELAQRPSPRHALVATVMVAILVLFALPAYAQRRDAAYESTLLAIQQHIQGGDLDGAHLLLVQAAKQYPADGGLENLLGVVEIQQGHTEAAEQAFSQAIRHSPRLTSAYLNLGRLYMQDAGKDAAAQARALHVYERALTVSPANAEANYQAAVLSMRSQHYERSLAYLAKMDSAARSGAGPLAIACADQAGLGRKEETASTAAALAAHPDLTEADAMGILPTLLTARRADIAIPVFSVLATRGGLSPAGLRAMGLAEEAAGTLSDARSTLERAFAVDSTSTPVLVDLARVSRAQKDYQGALGYLAHARDIAPANPSLPYYFGLACLDAGLLGEARKALADALRLAPENPDYNFAMGTVTSFAEDSAEALPYLQKYHALRPENPAGVLALGTTYFRAKDFDSARTWLKQSAANPKTAATADYYLGRIARQEGRLDDAIADLNRALSLRQDQPEVLAELGQVYLQKRMFPEAGKQLDRAISLNPDSYAANFSLLQLYARTGDSRREQQSKRFEEIKSKNETENQEMMRIIEIRPQEGSPR
jgi:tetratricopeptide (TPR) repeat protein